MKKIIAIILILLFLSYIGFITINPIGTIQIKKVIEWIKSRDWKNLFESVQSFLFSQPPQEGQPLNN